MQIRVNTLALGARLPSMHGFREYVRVGRTDVLRAELARSFPAADLVDKKLRGAKPANRAVERPTKFDLVINLTTAKALGLKIPEALLLRANEVIE